MLPTFSICFCLVPSINELEMLGLEKARIFDESRQNTYVAVHSTSKHAKQKTCIDTQCMGTSLNPIHE